MKTKNVLLVLGLFSLLAVFSAVSAEAQITLEEKIYVSEPTRVEIASCDWKSMIRSLFFKPVRKSWYEGEGYYYVLKMKSQMHRDDGYQEFAVELTNCQIERAEKTEYVSLGYNSYVSYDFVLASFPFDIDLGRSDDGLRKVLSIWVVIQLEVEYLKDLDREKEFFEKVFRHPERPFSVKGMMGYYVHDEKENRYPSSLGEIDRLVIKITPKNR